MRGEHPLLYRLMMKGPDFFLIIKVKEAWIDITVLNTQTNTVFYISGYNGYSGDIKGTVNIGTVLSPQRRGRVPQYSKNRMDQRRLFGLSSYYNLSHFSLLCIMTNLKYLVHPWTTLFLYVHIC